MGITLTGRVAIITGAANGIGRETALTLARAGAAVVLWDRMETAGQELAAAIAAEGGQVLFSLVDVTDQASIEQAVGLAQQRFGKVDILINNAGITRDARFIKVRNDEIQGAMSDAEFDAVVTVNLRGVFACSRAVAPLMIRQRHGRIINAASVVALYGNFGQTNYVATKAGVIGMTKVWARELGKYGITVNAVAPGFIATDMTASMPASAFEQMVARTPVGRAGQPSDVANAYLFLASDSAAFINGTVLSVDGGLVIGT